MADEDIDVRVRLRESRTFRRDTRRAAEDVDDLGDSLRRTRKETDRSVVSFQLLTRGLIAFGKLTAILSFVGLLGGGLAALVGAAMAVLGAWGPMSAAIVAFPGAVGAVIQSMVTLKFAMGGVGDALGGLTEQIDPEKFAALNVEAQRFVLFLNAFKSPLRDIQRDIQGALFPGLAQGLSMASANLGVLKAQLPATGAAIGGIAAMFGGLIGSASFGRDLSTMMANNVTWVTILGRSLVGLADIFRHVMVVAGPFITWMFLAVETWIQGKLAAAELGRETGIMAAFFDRSRDALVLFIQTGRNLWAILINIGRAGTGLGTDLLVSLERTSAAFAQWTGSAEGQARMMQFFQDIREPTYEMFKLVSAITKAFFALGEMPGLTGMIAQLRTDLLPVLMDLLTTATVSFGPVLLGALTNIIQLMAALSDGAGPLAVFVLLIGETAGFLAMIIEHTGPLGTILFTVLAVGAAFKLLALVMKFATAITGISTLVKWINWWRIAQNRATAATYADIIAQRLRTVATKAAAGATWALNLALWSSPITWIIVGLAALAVGFYLLYTRVEAFRNAVQAVWGWIKDNWPLLLVSLTGPIGLAVIAIIAKWDAIKQSFGAAVDWIRDKWNSVIDWVLDKLDWLPGPVKSFLGLGGGRDYETSPSTAGELALTARARAEAPTPKLRAPSVARVPVTAAAFGDGAAPGARTTIAKVYLDKRQIAEAVAEENDDREARR